MTLLKNYNNSLCWYVCRDVERRVFTYMLICSKVPQRKSIMEQNKMWNLFIARRLKPTVNQVFSLRENWVGGGMHIETWHAASLHQCPCEELRGTKQSKSKQTDITLLTVEFILLCNKLVNMWKCTLYLLQF